MTLPPIGTRVVYTVKHGGPRKGGKNPDVSHDMTVTGHHHGEAVLEDAKQRILAAPEWLHDGTLREVGT